MMGALYFKKATRGKPTKPRGPRARKGTRPTTGTRTARAPSEKSLEKARTKIRESGAMSFKIKESSKKTS